MEKSKRKIRVEGVGLDCSTLPYRPAQHYLPDYLYIDTSANNFSLVEDMLEDKSVIVRVGTSGVGMLEILKGIGLKAVDVLLLPTTTPIDIEELKKILDQFEIGCVGIDRPENLTQCREAAEEIKKVILPTYVSLSISPVHFQKDIIDWAEENEIDVLGLVENMSYFVCPDCKKKHEIFGKSQIDETAAELGLPVLAKLPMNPEAARLVDEGRIEDVECPELDEFIDALK